MTAFFSRGAPLLISANRALCPVSVFRMRSGKIHGENILGRQRPLLASQPCPLQAAAEGEGEALPCLEEGEVAEEVEEASRES